MLNENTICKTKNQLLILGQPDESKGALKHLVDNFCGVVVRSEAEIAHHGVQGRTYACGDLSQINHTSTISHVIGELSTNPPDDVDVVSLGQVPILVHNVGVFYRHLFDDDQLFARIQKEHQFQQLTESTKQSKALRTGIYLTNIDREFTDDDREILHHRLLRCSSNLTGPTDNFRKTDHMIMQAINTMARDVFEQDTSLNHVLAQIYQNTKDTGERPRERKAKIGAHSDKTKDMREDGLIAFCTFYDPEGFDHLTRSERDPYDWCHKQSSGLTTLYFKLKKSVDNPELTKEFSVTLYPNSVFIIPLSTNRMYTHAIRPSLLNIDRIPTRMGYVARSSSAEAQFMDGQTYLKNNGALIPLEAMTHETLSALRNTYYQENISGDEVTYGEVHFSMNTGDYQKPIY